ncbi:hypothetical protein COO60DRAFT_932553 [Scenedesmus sp. NREL 46B-D3]|nr:hypothetical protein COO60DRAFT_932553 [Scenedesmus sp. NREL 46B-D3]
MANRKARPIEGEVCWFCKQPADHESWMGLGFLKSTSQPVFEGNYILYHEPCAVYSNGAGNVPADGMDDETVYKFWFHGEKCSGIGFKCQLCGLKGATTGCLDEPCQQFYHYPCARVRAAQGHLQFSLQCRAMACSKHLDMLPLPPRTSSLACGWKAAAPGTAASWLRRRRPGCRTTRATWRRSSRAGTTC